MQPLFLTSACVASVATFAFLTISRLRGARVDAMATRVVLALFLAGMPLIYIGCALPTPPMLEVLALPLFALLAFAGAWRSPRLLGWGILLHGVAWDSWHVVDEAVVPRWYAIGCLVVDVALAVYVLRASPRE